MGVKGILKQSHENQQSFSGPTGSKGFLLLPPTSLDSSVSVVTRMLFRWTLAAVPSRTFNYACLETNPRFASDGQLKHQNRSSGSLEPISDNNVGGNEREKGDEVRVSM